MLNSSPTQMSRIKSNEFKIDTIWGMLTYGFGAYAKIKHLDKQESAAPDTELIKDVLSEAKVPIVILMDEIVHYVFNMSSQTLENTGIKLSSF